MSSSRTTWNAARPARAPGTWPSTESSAYTLDSRYGRVRAWRPEVPAAGGGAKISSTRSGSPPCANAWCQVFGPNVTLCPAATRCTSPVSGSAITIVPDSTCSSSSAPKTVRNSGECVKRPPTARPKTRQWTSSVEA